MSTRQHPVAETTLEQLAELGSATVYEAGGRGRYVDADFHQVIAGSRVAGPARTVRCGQDDNLMVHAAMAAFEPGDILVLTMPEPRAVALVGDLLATQAQVHGVRALLIDASIRDVETLRTMGLPIWARWIRVRGAAKAELGTLGTPVSIGGATIADGDILVMDADGIAVIEPERAPTVLEASRAREEKERIKRERLQAGALSWEIDGLRAQFAPGSTPS